jgi:hypothetical protein
MRYLTLAEIVELHRRILQVTDGATRIRDLGTLEAAVAQPKATFDGVDLYPTLVDRSVSNRPDPSDPVFARARRRSGGMIRGRRPRPRCSPGCPRGRERPEEAP